MALVFAGSFLLDVDMVAAVIARDIGDLILGRCQHFGEFHAGLITHLIQHPDHILGGQITGCAGCKGTAAQTAQSRLEQMMPQLAKEAGATEELKASDPMKWVGLMNTCKAQAEEILMAELINS